MKDESSSGRGRNKLRTYKIFKHAYSTEIYVKCHLPRAHRSALAKFRCGVAPLKIETGRYEGLAPELRFCFNCPNMVESEEHVLTQCPLYDDFRFYLFKEAESYYGNFSQLSNTDKMCTVLADKLLVKSTAKTCHNILRRRRRLLYV